MTSGPLPREAVAKLTGLELLRQIVSGELPAPPFSDTTAIVPIIVEPGFVVFEGRPTRGFMNPLGITHGGWISTLLDSAMSCAVHSQLPAGRSYTTVEMKINFVKAVTEDMPPLRCEGRVVHLGGRIALSEGRVLNPSGGIVAHGTETCLLFDAR